MNQHPIVLPDNEHDENIYLRAIDLLVKHLESSLAPNVTTIAGQYGPIPLSPSIFAYGLTRAVDAMAMSNSTTLSFLDVGCGIGAKLLLAEWMFPNLKCEGIESHPTIAKVAWVLGANVKIADAFEWDEYDRFDIVYAYRPCSDWDMEERLERRVMSCMREGAVLFLVGGQVEPEPSWERISGSVWKKR